MDVGAVTCAAQAIMEEDAASDITESANAASDSAVGDDTDVVEGYSHLLA